MHVLVCACVCGCGRSPVPGYLPPPAVSPATSSSGSETASITEFKQVKLHAQNQILLLKILADEKEQVRVCVAHAEQEGGGAGRGMDERRLTR